MIGVREFARRAVLPTAAAWLSDSKAATALRSRVSRLRGVRPRAELFIALDDPYSSLALDTCADLVAFGVDTQVFPVVRRGIAGDPVADLRRHYAVTDARRLYRRRGLELARKAPIERDRVEDLAYWIEAARDHRGDDAALELLRAFAARLWLSGPELPDFGELYALYRKSVGESPPTVLVGQRMRVRQNESRLYRRGHWDTPTVWIEGRWYFAHDRREQIAQYAMEIAG